MRPPEFTGGNTLLRRIEKLPLVAASMRPPEFTGGNTLLRRIEKLPLVAASMRPPEFTGGNHRCVAGPAARHHALQ